MSRLALALCVSLAFVAPALAAQKLPARAKPFSPDEVTAIYSGNSIEWSAGAAYLAADGSLTAYWSKKGDEAYGSGKWTVEGNEFCYSASWVNAAKPFDETFCWKIYHAGKKVWFEETKASDGRALTVTLKSPPVSKGDKATTQAAAMKAVVGK